jgi:peptidoglycan hydrolase-like protein with peptidoglycan-binding domain
MVAWRTANSLVLLRKQAREFFDYSVRVDFIGDAAHASRVSDHNPWIIDPDGPNVVSAGDFFLPAEWLQAFVDQLVNSRDRRIKYIIHNRKIWRSYRTNVNQPPAWEPESYIGINPHVSHVHLSVNSAKAFYDNVDPWPVFAGTAPVVNPNPTPPVVLPTPAPEMEYDMRTIDLRSANSNLVRGNYHIDNMQGLLLAAQLGPAGLVDSSGQPDGIAGPGTRAALGRFQQIAKLPVDYICGPVTWKKLIEW